MALAEVLRALISQRKAWANPLCSQTTARAVPSGLAMARFLGTSSPKTIDRVVASSSDRAVAVPEATPSDSPSASSPGRSSSAMAGSAM